MIRASASARGPSCPRFPGIQTIGFAAETIRMHYYLVNSGAQRHHLPFHAQIATDVEDDNVRIVTMYVPRSSRVETDRRIRRRLHEIWRMRSCVSTGSY